VIRTRAGGPRKMPGRHGRGVAVLGGGVAGMSAAHELAHRGFQGHRFRGRPDARRQGEEHLRAGNGKRRQTRPSRRAWLPLLPVVRPPSARHDEGHSIRAEERARQPRGLGAPPRSRHRHPEPLPRLRLRPDEHGRGCLSSCGSCLFFNNGRPTTRSAAGDRPPRKCVFLRGGGRNRPFAARRGVAFTPR
jgi:hypothetical protein